MKGKTFKNKGLDFLKRVMSTVLVVAMLFTMVGIYIPAETFKADEGVDITIHFKDEPWLDDGINLYAWGGSASTTFAGWPGNAMEENTANTGYYSITIEDYAAETDFNYIINGTENGVGKQSVDCKISASDLTADYECWTSLGGWSEGKFVPNVTTTAPDGWVKQVDITIHFKTEEWLDDGINLYAWGGSASTTFAGWPGNAMDKDTANTGYYSITIEDYAVIADFNYIINGTENGVGKQSVDCKIVTSDLTADYECWTSLGGWSEGKFVPNVTTTAPEGWVTGTESTPEIPEEEEGTAITVRFQNTQNWSTVNAYAWDENGTAIAGSWPGTAITKDGDYYVWTKENWDVNDPLNIIFNNGSEQTVDLSISSEDFAKDTEWIFIPTVKNDGGKWECKKIDVAPYDKAAIAGNFHSFDGSGQPEWNPAGGTDGAGLMEYLGDGYYYKKITFNELAAATEAKFKATFNGDWNPQIGGSGANADSDGNYVLSVPAGATYVEIIADTVNGKLYNSVEHATDIEEILVELGLIQASAEMEVIDHVNGTTTFVALAEAGKEVVLYYGVRSEVEVNGAAALKSVVMTERANESGTYESEALFLGDDALDYVYYYDVEGTRTLDGSNLTISVGGENYSNYTREAFDGRIVTVPGSFPNASWDVASHQMAYKGNGLYEYTFEDLAAGKYEYKIALNKSWDPENYGAGGVGHGPNIALSVPTTQDVTIYYSDFSHYAVDSVSYIFADITLAGTGITGSVKLKDDGLTGIYSVTIDMAAGTYSDYKFKYDNDEYALTEFTLTEAKEVTFYFDPVTCIFYHNASNDPVEEDNIYYTTKDEAYKSIFGSVEQNADVTFTIKTGTDASAVTMVVKGMENKTLSMTKATASNGVQTWSVTTSFATIGEYDYYFIITNGADIVVYGDDSSYAGKGKVCELTDCIPYELVVHVAGFETPDWMKNAVIYQIFPDRFYNGDTSNDQAQTSARGEVDYEFVDDWYLLPENPEQEELLTEEAYKAHNAYYGDGNWSNEIYGGDLEGIIEKIDYLKALGVNVIYLNPIFASISNHRYDACDYTEIDPILGTLGDFEELVEVAEENDMHIILDGVFNHVSDDSIYFDRYYKFLGKSEKVGAYPYWAYVYDYMAENGADQATAETAAKAYFTEKYGITDYSYTEWFAVNNAYMTDTEGKNVVDNIGLRAGKPVYTYEGWWGYDSMPVIYSTNGSEYQTGNWAEEIIYNEEKDSVTQYWISKGNDGWRLDVANEVSDETWQKFRDSVKALDSEAVIIGEIWDDATKYLMGDMYDSVMNYVFRNAVLGYANGDTAATAMETLERIRERYPEEAFYAMMNLVGSHDTTRVLSFLDGIQDDRNQKDEASAFPTYETTSEAAKKEQYLVALIQFTYAGAPTIYYGDEIGMVGSDDPDDRRAMEWGKGNKELVTWYATLAAIREQHDVLRTGSVEPIVLNDNVMGYVRRDADEVMIILVNNATSDKDVELDLTSLDVDADTLIDLLTNTNVTVEGGKATITVPAVNGVILSETAKTYTVDQENLAPAYDEEYIVKPEEPKPEGDIAVEGSDIDREDVTIAEAYKNNEIVQEDNKENVILGNDKMPDLTIKGETDTLDKDAFFVRKYLVEGELYQETVELMNKNLKEIDEFKVLKINLYSGEGVQITQLEDNVYVTIPVPADITLAEGSVLAVYRVNSDGSFTNCNATIVDGRLTFSTNILSTFVIVEQVMAAVVPETGDTNMGGAYFLLLLAGCAVVGAGTVNSKKRFVK